MVEATVMANIHYGFWTKDCLFRVTD